MRAHIREFRLVAMCRVLGVHRSGYYAWLRQGTSARERDDQRLLGLIRHHWLASGAVYGYRKITLDLREAGEHCSRHRVRRLMKAEGLRAQVGYGSKPRHRGGPVGAVDNVLNRGRVGLVSLGFVLCWLDEELDRCCCDEEELLDDDDDESPTTTTS